MSDIGDPNYRAAEQERGERWLRGIVTVLALSSIVPLVQVIADWLRPSVLPRLESWGGWVEAQEGSDTSAADAGAFMVAMPVFGITVGLFFWLMRRRKVDSRRTVDRAVADGSVPYSPLTLRLTALAWTQLLVLLAVCGTFLTIASGPSTSADAQRFIDNPTWALLIVVGAAGMTGFSYWYHRRVFQLEPSGAVRTATQRHAEGTNETPTYSEGTRLFGKAMVIEGGFGVAAFGQGTINGTLGPLSDFSIEFFIYALFVPAFLSGMLLVMLYAFRPTRWMADDALHQPTTKLALWLMAGGLVGAGLGELLPLWVTVVAVLVLMAGAGIASVTQLYIQDLGPQPLLGTIYLVMLFVFNAFGTGQDDLALPEGPFAWVVTLGLTVFLGRELYALWSANYDRPTAPPASPPAAPDASVDLSRLPPPTPKPGA